MRIARRFAVAAASAAVLAAGTLAPTPSNAALIQLGFIIDGSGSIGSTAWNTIRTGLSNAIGLIPVGGPDTYEVSVVQFSSTTVTHAANVVLNTASDRSTLATTIAGITQLGNRTDYQDAFAAMQTVLGNTIASADYSYVNFATDGAPNQCGTTDVDEPGGRACAVTARNALLAIGVDNLSIEGIGVTADDATFLQGSICSPLTCDTTSPYDFPTSGFYIAVANADEYASALETKVRIVTQQAPEPGTLALAGLALAGIGVARRRQPRA